MWLRCWRRLGGYHPFDPYGTASEDELRRAVKRLDYSFDDPVWHTVSKDAKDLISSMLQLDADSRPSAKRVLQHRWFSSHLAGCEPGDEDLLVAGQSLQSVPVNAREQSPGRDDSRGRSRSRADGVRLRRDGGKAHAIRTEPPCRAVQEPCSDVHNAPVSRPARCSPRVDDPANRLGDADADVEAITKESGVRVAASATRPHRRTSVREGAFNAALASLPVAAEAAPADDNFSTAVAIAAPRPLPDAAVPHASSKFAPQVHTAVESSPSAAPRQVSITSPRMMALMVSSDDPSGEAKIPAFSLRQEVDAGVVYPKLKGGHSPRAAAVPDVPDLPDVGMGVTADEFAWWDPRHGIGTTNLDSAMPPAKQHRQRVWVPTARDAEARQATPKSASAKQVVSCA